MTADTRAANSLSPPPDPAPLANPSRHVDVEIVVPVFNEEAALGPSVERLLARLQDFPFSSRVVIADNASTDATLSIAHELADRHDRVSVFHLDAKGRGRAPAGRRPMRTSSHTWTSTCPPIWTPFSRSSRR